MIYQTTITLPSHGLGPIDIEVDNVNDVLFISYEEGNPGTGGFIEMYGATTLNYLGFRDLYSTLCITGLAYDPAREYLYFTNRSNYQSTSGLFVYAWNPQTRTLTHVASNGLTNPYATGLALNGDTLYVSKFSYNDGWNPIFFNDVYAYHIEAADDFEETAIYNMGTYAVAIDCDTTRQLLYTGSYLGEHKIAKYPLAGGSAIVMNIGASINGLAVDPVTGYVYAAEGSGGLEIFDPNEWTSSGNASPIFTYNPIPDGITLGNLAGVCIAEHDCDPNAIVYVNINAGGNNDGSSWENAFTDLSFALASASAGLQKEFWIAQGTYTPGTLSSSVFTIPSGVGLYGGFAGTETSRSQRSSAAYPTVLSGNNVCDNVLKTSSGSPTIDGFIITGAVDIAIYCSGTSNYPTITHCIIQNNFNAIYSQGYCPVIMADNWINNNTQYGILLDGDGFTSLRPVIQNNTLANNGDSAIKRSDNYSTSITVDVKNCILWGVAKEIDYSTATLYYNFTYCASDDPNVILYAPPGSQNIDLRAASPGFVYEAGNDYHLLSDSLCINKGDSSVVSPGETDIDNQPRIFGSSVDIGADEYCLNNLHEFSILAKAWLSDPAVNHQNWNPLYDFDESDMIDEPDMTFFATDYWLQDALIGSLVYSQGEGMMAMGGQDSLLQSDVSMECSALESLDSALADVDTSSYAYVLYVGPDVSLCDAQTVEDALALMRQYELSESARGLICIETGIYIESLGSGENEPFWLPAHCDLIGLGAADADIVLIDLNEILTDENASGQTNTISGLQFCLLPGLDLEEE